MLLKFGLNFYSCRNIPNPNYETSIQIKSENGAGQWNDWHGDWGLPFIWTSLNVFGGNDGLKGKMSLINAIPYEAPPIASVKPGYDPKTQAVGVGYTPEGMCVYIFFAFIYIICFAII